MCGKPVFISHQAKYRISVWFTGGVRVCVAAQIYPCVPVHVCVHVCVYVCALTSPWLKKKHTVVTRPPKRLPLGREKKDSEHKDEREVTRTEFAEHQRLSFPLAYIFESLKPLYPLIAKALNVIFCREVKGQGKIPEVCAIYEEQAHHEAVQEEHKGHIKVCWVAQA